jgi:hypothetical protein
VTEQEGSDGEMRASQAEPAAGKLELLLSHPEIIAWLDLSRTGVVAWLGSPGKADEDDERARVA